MGYTTEFQGQFTFDKPLDNDTFNFFKKFSYTRRVKRAVGPEFGVEGEFYVDGGRYFGEDDDDLNILDYNKPPSTQPSLWCQWIPTEDRLHIEWDRIEKFYEYVEWLEYIIEKILAPRGYTLSGEVDFQGEEKEDNGIIQVTNNKIKVAYGVGRIPFEDEEDFEEDNE